MPTLVILATSDDTLASAWQVQVPAGRSALRIGNQAFPGGTTSSGFAAVIVLDSAYELELPSALVHHPTIYVGEPRTAHFEQAKMSRRAKLYLSYDESATRLGEMLPLVEELAEKQSLVQMLSEKVRRSEPQRSLQRPTTEAAELWDFLEAAVESVDAKDRLIAEFRRASRHVLRASHAVFFLREPDGFRADRGTSFFSADDGLVSYFESHPTIVDGCRWEAPADPVAELAVRNRLALWGARLLVPIHDNGRLLGLIALGVRDDGQAYDEGDRVRAVFFARLFRHFLSKSAQVARLINLAEQSRISAKYLPGTLVLGPNETVPRHLPLVIRDAIGQARRNRAVCRVSPSIGQPFRASAGLIEETGGTWAFWEEVSSEVHEVILRERLNRREVLRELALTMSHEVGNALVSLTTFRQTGPDRPLPLHLIDTIKSDVAQLEQLNGNLALMQALHEVDASPVDIRELVQNVGQALGMKVEVSSDSVILSANQKLLDFAIRALLHSISENRREQGLREIVLKVRGTGAGADRMALLSLRGRHLELEGILPEPIEGAVPNQGRLGVFLAKEILRMHQGEIHAGPGMEGTEILISIRSL